MDEWLLLEDGHLGEWETDIFLYSLGQAHHHFLYSLHMRLPIHQPALYCLP